MKKIKERIYIGSSIVYELLVSMFRVECHEKLLPENQQYVKYVSDDLMNWVEKSRSKLTEDLKKDLSIFFNYESFLGLTLFWLILENNCYTDIDDFFNFMNQYPAKDLVKNFFVTGYGSTEMLKSIDDIADVRSFLDKSALPEMEKWKLMYFCSNPEETKKRFLTLIKEFYIVIFKENIEMLQNYHNQSIKYLEEKMCKNPYDVIKKLINFDLANTDDKIIFIPSYYYNTASHVSYFEDSKRLIYVYGIAQTEINLSDNISTERILASIKVLSDENRIKIIGILNSNQCYGYELAQKLGISSSTVSHHLSLLSDIDVITSVREENKVYYQVNKDNIRKLLKQFENMLT